MTLIGIWGRKEAILAEQSLALFTLDGVEHDSVAKHALEVFYALLG